MDKHYADTVRLLLNIAPDVFDNDIDARNNVFSHVVAELVRCFRAVHSSVQSCNKCINVAQIIAIQTHL